MRQPTSRGRSRSGVRAPWLPAGGIPVKSTAARDASRTHLLLPVAPAFAPERRNVAVIAVLSNLPDSESAFNLGRELVRLRLAACVNVLGAATSFYRWEGREEEATEV